MSQSFNLISPQYFEAYSKALEVDLSKSIKKLSPKQGFTKEDFEFYFIASSVFSSRIEGNTLDLNSFMRLRGEKASAKKKEVKEIEDLVEAYNFAFKNKLTQINFLKAHQILSKTVLSKASERGKFRKMQIAVYDNTTGKPAYLALEPEYLEKEVGKLFSDIKTILNKKLNTKETFYYASTLHLWLAMLHPFTDGNGRAARLLEKWFLASTIGDVAWSVNSEKYYWDNRPAYYTNIALGYNYYALHWERSIPFLLMLPEALNNLQNRITP
jgi:Fic family protein